MLIRDKIKLGFKLRLANGRTTKKKFSSCNLILMLQHLVHHPPSFIITIILNLIVGLNCLAFLLLTYDKLTSFYDRRSLMNGRLWHWLLHPLLPPRLHLRFLLFISFLISSTAPHVNLPTVGLVFAQEFCHGNMDLALLSDVNDGSKYFKGQYHNR